MAEQALLNLKLRRWPLVIALASLSITLIGVTAWTTLAQTHSGPSQASPLSRSAAEMMPRGIIPDSRRTISGSQTDTQRSAIPDITGGVNSSQVTLQSNAPSIANTAQPGSGQHAAMLQRPTGTQCCFASNQRGRRTHGLFPQLLPWPVCIVWAVRLF